MLWKSSLSGSGTLGRETRSVFAFVGRPVVVAAQEEGCRPLKSVAKEDVEQRLEEVANEEKDERPEVGAAEDM